MRKILLLSIVLTAFTSCGHMYGHKSDCACKGQQSGQQSCSMKDHKAGGDSSQDCPHCKEKGSSSGKAADKAADKKEECDDCKKGGKS